MNIKFFKVDMTSESKLPTQVSQNFQINQNLHKKGQQSPIRNMNYPYKIPSRTAVTSQRPNTTYKLLTQSKQQLPSMIVNEVPTKPRLQSHRPTSSQKYFSQKEIELVEYVQQPQVFQKTSVIQTKMLHEVQDSKRAESILDQVQKRFNPNNSPLRPQTSFENTYKQVLHNFKNKKLVDTKDDTNYRTDAMAKQFFQNNERLRAQLLQKQENDELQTLQQLIQ